MGSNVGCLKPGYDADLIGIAAPHLTRAGLFDYLSFYRDAGPVAVTSLRGVNSEYIQAATTRFRPARFAL